MDYHRYLNVIGGFLSATVEPSEGDPAFTFRLHEEQGDVKFEGPLSAL